MYVTYSSAREDIFIDVQGVMMRILQGKKGKTVLRRKENLFKILIEKFPSTSFFLYTSLRAYYSFDINYLAACDVKNVHKS